jgi:glutamate 5-kinase
MKKSTIVVKIGTNALSNDDGSLNKELMEDFVNQLATLNKEANVLLVSSGAMGAGRDILKKKLPYDDVTSRQLYAVVGQVKLMEIYSKLFESHRITVAQMLATKQDFENREHFLNTKNCIESLFRENIIPILNENDFVCIEELMFTDNDELAGIISKLLFAEKLIILSNVDGVYDEAGKVIESFSCEEEIPSHIKSADKSSFGKGGMQTKFEMAQKVAAHGTEVYIANSTQSNVLTRIVAGEELGTKFKKKND